MHISKKHLRWRLAARLLAGLSGIGLLAAIGVATWRRSLSTTDLPPQFLPPVEMQMHLPTRPFDPAGPCRVLHHLVIVRKNPLGGITPLHAEEFEIPFPQERGKTLVRTFPLGREECSYSIRIDDLQAFGEGEPHVIYESDFGSRGRRHNASHGSSGSARAGTVSGALASYTPGGDPLELLPAEAFEYQGFSLFSLTSPEDPLEEISLPALCARYGLAMEAQAISANRWPRKGRPGLRIAGFIGFAEHAGPAALLLVLGALLAAQLLPRRGLAVPLVFFAALLCAAALDHRLLTRHLARLSDDSAPLHARGAAAARAQQTFFFKETARQAFRRISGDAKTPEPLRRHLEAFL